MTLESVLAYTHLLAILSPVKKELARDMDISSVFPSAAATNQSTRTLVVEAPWPFARCARETKAQH